MNGDVNSAERRMEGLNKIYDVMVKGGKGGVLSFLSLSSTAVCVNCAKVAEEEYERLRAAIWENLPRIFRVGKGWEDVSR